MTATPTTFGSVCSGIEAASVAFGPLGWTAAWLSEVAPFPCALLTHRYPHVPNLGDMASIARRVLTGEVPAPDVLCGGTPCQAFSVAGLRGSLADARGNLTITFIRIADAIDHIRARAGKPAAGIFWENVPGVLSTQDNAFGCFLAGLAGEDGALEPPEPRPADGRSSRHWKWSKKLGRHCASWSNAGAVYGPKRAIAWRTLDAQYLGLAQRRRRVFVVASARDGFDPAQVLFEWDGVRRDTAPSREAGQATAPCVTAGAANGGAAHGARSGSAKDNLIVPVAFGGNNQSGPIDVATARNACASASASGRMDFETETFLVQPAHSLRGEGFDASEDGTGRGTPLIPVAVDYTNGIVTPGGPTGTLEAAQSKSNRGIGVLAFNPNQEGMGLSNHFTPSIGASTGGGNQNCIAFPANLSGTQHASAENLAPAMGASNPTAAATAMRVRRLTPTECERLQGFPDGYTRIPDWNGWRELDEGENPDALRAEGLHVRQSPKTGKWRVNDPDGPRYKALGNSWPIPVVRWIGARMHAQLLRGVTA